MSFDCYTTLYFSTAVSFETMMARVVETLKVPPLKPTYWEGQLIDHTVSLLKLEISFSNNMPDDFHRDGHTYQYELDIRIVFPRSRLNEHKLYVAQVGRFWAHLFANKYDDLFILALDHLENWLFYSGGETHPEYRQWHEWKVDKDSGVREDRWTLLANSALLKQRSSDSIDPFFPSLPQTATIFIRSSDQVRNASQHSSDIRERLYRQLLYVMKAPLFVFHRGYQADTFHLNIRFDENDVKGAIAPTYPYEVEGERYDYMLKLSLLDPPQTHPYDTQYLLCMAKYWSRLIEYNHDEMISEIIATYGLSHVVYDSRREYSAWSLNWEATLPDQHRKQGTVADIHNNDTPPK